MDRQQQQWQATSCKSYICSRGGGPHTAPTTHHPLGPLSHNANRRPGRGPRAHSHTRAMIHETTGILPCRGGGDGLLHSLSPRARYCIFGRRPERIPTQITYHVDAGYSKAPLTHERAPITPWGCQHRWSCDYNLATCTTMVFFLHIMPHSLARLVDCGKATAFLLLPPPPKQWT
jgi:hypothetical protein